MDYQSELPLSEKQQGLCRPPLVSYSNFLWHLFLLGSRSGTRRAWWDLYSPIGVKSEMLYHPPGFGCLDTGSWDESWLNPVKCHKDLSVCFMCVNRSVFSGISNMGTEMEIGQTQLNIWMKLATEYFVSDWSPLSGWAFCVLGLLVLSLLSLPPLATATMLLTMAVEMIRDQIFFSWLQTFWSLDYWIQLSRDSNIFWMWIILNLFHVILLYWRVALTRLWLFLL